MVYYNNYTRNAPNNRRTSSESNALQERTINPYNFVPFGSEAPDRHTPAEVYATGDDLLTGWIRVILTTQTELIVPDTARVRQEKLKNDKGEFTHNTYPFFTLPDAEGNWVPTIPGSELRGMLRSVYEAASNSCLPFLLNDKEVSQRTMPYASFRNRGLLKYTPGEGGTGTWSLYETEVYKIATSQDKVQSGTYEGKPCGAQVKFDLKYNRTQKKEPAIDENGTMTGWLQFNVPVNPNGIYHVAILCPKEQPLYTWKPGDDEPLRALRIAMGRYDVKGNQKNPNEKCNKNLLAAVNRVAKTGGMVPVWYFEVRRGQEKLFYISNSSIGRVAQRRKWQDIMGEHSPCPREGKLCPACLLFGTTADGGMKGRVRVTDAVPLKEITLTDASYHTLQIMGEPRPSAFEFYMARPTRDATYWNFDYYGVPRPGVQMDTEYRDLAQTTPRGRKMYWHGKPVRDAAKGKLNATMQAVPTRTSFEFYVYFDAVTELQLDDLIWVITLGDNRADSNYCHKLGHAKPLGYGSVKLEITDCELRKLCRDGDRLYVTMEKRPVEQNPAHHFKKFDPKGEILPSLLAICDRSKTEGQTVAYPTQVDKKGNEAIYTWFTNNRKTGKGLLALPLPTSDDLTLPVARLPGQETADAAPNHGVEATVNKMYKNGRVVFDIPSMGAQGTALVTNRTLVIGQSVHVKVGRYDKEHNKYDLELADENT